MIILYIRADDIFMRRYNTFVECAYPYELENGSMPSRLPRSANNVFPFQNTRIPYIRYIHLSLPFDFLFKFIRNLVLFLWQCFLVARCSGLCSLLAVLMLWVPLSPSTLLVFHLSTIPPQYWTLRDRKGPEKKFVKGKVFDRFVTIWLENTNFASAVADREWFLELKTFFSHFEQRPTFFLSKLHRYCLARHLIEQLLCSHTSFRAQLCILSWRGILWNKQRQLGPYSSQHLQYCWFAGIEGHQLGRVSGTHALNWFPGFRIPKPHDWSEWLCSEAQVSLLLLLLHPTAPKWLFDWLILTLDSQPLDYIWLRSQQSATQCECQEFHIVWARSGEQHASSMVFHDS